MTRLRDRILDLCLAHLGNPSTPPPPPPVHSEFLYVPWIIT